jgi:hypothetical protein
MASTTIVCFALTLLPLAYAASKFEPHCPLPPPGTNYVAGPNVRSTLSILWNCLSVILLCTWNIQHLNIPVQRKTAEEVMGKDVVKWKKWGQEVLWWIEDFAIPIKWMTITVFAPEFLVGKAFCEWRSSIDISEYVKKAEGWEVLKKPVGVHLANMGYFVLDWGSALPLSSPENKANSADQNPPATGQSEDTGALATTSSASSLEVNENPGEKVVEPNKFIGLLTKQVHEALHDDALFLSRSTAININRLRARYWALNSGQWYALKIMSPNLVDFPDTFELQPDKLEQRGFLLKALTVLQVLNLLIQLICRRARELPSTQLEIATAAFAACGAVTYLLYWSRPRSIKATRIIRVKDRIEGVVLRSLITWLGRFGPTYIWTEHRSKLDANSTAGPNPIPNDSNTVVKSTVKWIDELTAGNQELTAVFFGALLGGTIFGGLHCLAWNFHFPTHGEALGWRICSVATTALPIMSSFPIFIWLKLHPSEGLEDWGQRSRLLLDMREKRERQEGERAQRLARIEAAEAEAELERERERELGSWSRPWKLGTEIEWGRWGERGAGAGAELEEREQLELEREREEQEWFEELEEKEKERRNGKTTPPLHKTTRAWLKGVIAFFCVVVLLVPYILARLFLLVEVFRTLGFLPPDAFVDTWSGSLPHFG